LCPHSRFMFLWFILIILFSIRMTTSRTHFPFKLMRSLPQFQKTVGLFDKISKTDFDLEINCFPLRTNVNYTTYQWNWKKKKKFSTFYTFRKKKISNIAIVFFFLMSQGKILMVFLILISTKTCFGRFWRNKNQSNSNRILSKTMKRDLDEFENFFFFEKFEREESWWICLIFEFRKIKI